MLLLFVARVRLGSFHTLTPPPPSRPPAPPSAAPFASVARSPLSCAFSHWVGCVYMGGLRGSACVCVCVVMLQLLCFPLLTKHWPKRQSPPPVTLPHEMPSFILAGKYHTAGAHWSDTH
jgi:hypothetical protein